MNTPLQHLTEFLKVKTPLAWIEHAITDLPMLLIDHAHCERKAAATALNFMSKYPEKRALVAMMSPLAREELLHFEKVLTLMQQRQIAFCALKPANYASQMHKKVTNRDGIERLCDQLIIGAIIEARSCERFNAIIPYLEDSQLAKFYTTLVKAEARHFEEYLRLAKDYGGDIDDRITLFLSIENEYITSSDEVFRFHSGIPACSINHSLE